MVVMEDVTEEERSAELYVSVHGSLDHTFLKRGGRGSYPLFRQNQQSRIWCCQMFLVCVLWRWIYVRITLSRFEQWCVKSESPHMKSNSLQKPFFLQKWVQTKVKVNQILISWSILLYLASILLNNIGATWRGSFLPSPSFSPPQWFCFYCRRIYLGCFLAPEVLQ